MKAILEKIYYSLPLPLQNLAITAFGYTWYKRRFGGIFNSELKACMERDMYTQTEWENYQTLELRKLLHHALNTVPYYQTLFKELGINTAAIQNFSLSDLSRLPFLEKQTYRKLGITDLMSQYPEPNGQFLYSSGSTGTPTQTRYSLRMHQKYFAIFESRLNYWAGIDYKVARGVIGGRRIIKDGKGKPPYYRYNYIEKQTYFSAYHISKETVGNYVEGMVKNKVEYMTGYASANYFLARFIEEAGIKAPKLKAVLTSSEKLTQEMRDTFKRVYDCETFDSYNGVDLCNLISECEYHSLHVVPDAGIVEVIRPDGAPCSPGETGEIISTGLLNFDQPLIRYRMGDYVTLSKNQRCACGRSMPVIEEIVGRMEDTVTGPDGRKMVRFHGIFINIPSIIEAQVVQHTLYDYELNLVTSAPPTEEERALLIKRMKSQLGEVNVKINLIEEIPKNANGKFKSVVSLIHKN
ncbi:MAG: phenylacetate--CoA ligase family protein [Bacteroidota bacterium]